MKKEVKIQGLDCPNCARSLENEFNKLKNVKNAEIDFLKSTLTFESDDCEKAFKDIVNLAKKVEPNAKISEKIEKKLDFMLIFDVILLFLGVGLGIMLFFVKLPTWAYWTLYCVAALMLGYKTYYKAAKQLFKGIINENLLITISVIGASIISEHMEGLMVITLYTIGKIFEGLAVGKARKSISSLAKMQPEYANLVKRGKIEVVSPEQVKIGNIILVKPGEKVPIDGEIIEGTCLLDKQSLTGESVPVTAKTGDKILSGSIVLDSAIKIKTTKPYSDSAISKIMNLVENASKNKSKTETFISKITKYYTLGVVVLAILVFGIVYIISKDLSLSFYRGLIFLVISCPCAFAISVPLTYFAGLGNASKNGILIKGSNYLDACAKLKTLAFDKTGTLTSGEFEIVEVESDKISKSELIYLAALGEQNSVHPLAKAIVSACKKKLKSVENFKEIAGSGVKFSYNNKNYFVGRKNKKLQNTVVEVYENDVKLGQIICSDKIKSTSKATIEELKKMQIKTVLLSGDNKASVSKVASEIGIDEALDTLLPEDKFDWIEKNKKGTAYVGDGINDAPALSLADVGISMSINGSPASIEASDMVLVDDDPYKIITAIKIAKRTKKIVLENIIVSAVVKVTFLALGSFGITGMLAAVFADVGVTLLAILNSLRALKIKNQKKK